MVLQELVEPRGLARLVVAFREVGCVARRVGVQAGRELEIAVLLVEVGGHRLPPWDVLVDLGQRRQSCGRAVGFADTPIVRLNRAVAVGEADGALAGLAALGDVDEDVPRREAVAAYLHEKNGDLELAARLYANAARNAPNLAERDHQMRQAARLNQHLKNHG